MIYLHILKSKDILSVSLSLYSLTACLISAGFKGIRVPDYYMLWFQPPLERSGCLCYLMCQTL